MYEDESVRGDIVGKKKYDIVRDDFERFCKIFIISVSNKTNIRLKECMTKIDLKNIFHLK